MNSCIWFNRESNRGSSCLQTPLNSTYKIIIQKMKLKRTPAFGDKIPLSTKIQYTIYLTTSSRRHSLIYILYELNHSATLQKIFLIWNLDFLFAHFHFKLFLHHQLVPISLSFFPSFFILFLSGPLAYIYLFYLSIINL